MHYYPNIHWAIFTDHLILRNRPGLSWDKVTFLASSWYRAVFWIENENKCSVYKLGGKLARSHCLWSAWASINKWWPNAMSITCFAYSSSTIIIISLSSFPLKLFLSQFMMFTSFFSNCLLHLLHSYFPFQTFSACWFKYCWETEKDFKEKNRYYSYYPRIHR